MKSNLSLASAIVLLLIAASSLVYTISNAPNLITPKTQTAQVTGPGSGLVGYWNFDEGSGTTANDSSGNGRTGTLVNGPTWTTAGKIGNALSFDGVDDKVTINNDLIGTGAVTISAWIYPRTTGNQGYGVVINNGENATLCSLIGWDSNIGCGNNGGGTLVLAASNSILLNQWRLFTAVRDGTGMYTFYINGVQSGVASQAAGALTAGTRVMIGGSRDDGIYTFDGLIDDVRVYNRVLSATEIRQLYDGTPAPSTKFSINDRVKVTTPPISPSTFRPNIYATPSTSGTVLGFQPLGVLGTVIGGPIFADGYWWWNIDFDDSTIDGWLYEYWLTKVTLGDIAPSVPVNLVASNITQTSFTISWSPSTDDVAVLSYRIFVDGNRAGSSNTTSWTANGITPNTTYSIKVAALDATQLSGRSAPLSVTTLSSTASYSLTVAKQGAGTGTVRGGSIDCGSVCTTTATAGSVITLNATANTGSTFTGWTVNGSTSVCPSTTASCTFNLNAVTSVIATFGPVLGTTYNINVSTAGAGSGTVTCGGTTCPTSVPAGTSVTFRATPATGSTFIKTGWSGACSGISSTCTKTINSNTAVTANFDPNSTKFSLNNRTQVNISRLNVRNAPSEKLGIKLGTQVLDALGTIIGGPIWGDSYWWWNVNYDTNPDGWSIEDYLKIPTFSLSIIKSGTGTGSVTCGSIACPTSVPAGTPITLSATPDINSNFIGWTVSPDNNGSCGIAFTCNVTLNLNTTVTATFDRNISTDPTASISANPTSVLLGGSSNISWSSTNANSCTVNKDGVFWQSGFSGTNVSSGALSSNTNFSITCEATGKPSATANVTVTVGTPGQVIDPSRRIDWSRAGVPGVIPIRTTCQTIPAGASATTINAAIVACNNGVVQLSAGTYNIGAGGLTIVKSNVTLRGAGPDRTFLVFTGHSGTDSFSGGIVVGTSADHTSYLLTSDGWNGTNNQNGVYTKGATVLNLATTPTQLNVGDMITLDQDNDATDTGGLFVSTKSLEGCDYCGRGGTRSQMQIVKVIAINGSQITISPGIYMSNWRTSQNPQIFWFPNLPNQIDNVGIEDLSLDYTNSGGAYGISILHVYGGWVKNIKSLNANRAHIVSLYSAHTEIRDSYFYGTQNAASQSYGIETGASSDIKVENNIFQHISSPLMSGYGMEGAVFAYNFMTDMYIGPSSWMQTSIYGGHDAGAAMNFYEGNVGNGFLMDLYHGGSNFMTLFRNQLFGWETIDKTDQTSAIRLWSYNRLNNIVGNVLGKQGYHTKYEDSLVLPGTTGNPDRSIYYLGYCDHSDKISCLPHTAGGSSTQYDTYVISTLMRWGNFDYSILAGQTRWNASEIPVGVPVPSTQNLPDSLYLSGRPAWFNTLFDSVPFNDVPFPPIGPNVTGGNADPTGHAYKIPAQLCYENTPQTGSILNFNARNCYP